VTEKSKPPRHEWHEQASAMSNEDKKDGQRAQEIQTKDAGGMRVSDFAWK